jgi:hypothetical protein
MSAFCGEMRLTVLLLAVVRVQSKSTWDIFWKKLLARLTQAKHVSF